MDPRQLLEGPASTVVEWLLVAAALALTCGWLLARARRALRTLAAPAPGDGVTCGGGCGGCTADCLVRDEPTPTTPRRRR